MKNFLTITLLLLIISACGQEFKPNYDESKVPDYELPELLVAKDDSKITNRTQWEDKRRNEILADFEKYMYGRTPVGEIDVDVEKLQEMDAFEGKALMKEIRMTFSRNGKSISMDILIYLPKTADKVPLFLGYNFYGNHTIIDDKNVSIPTSWSRNSDRMGITENQPTEKSRGMRTSRWAVEKILDRGYGLATIYYGDIDPDKNDLSDGIHALYYDKGQIKPAKDEWGSIAGWAWGLSRAMDYLEKDALIDESKVAVMGHSRLGKTSFWAGALDPRFAIVISNDSGCGGSALSRRQFGETVWRINTSFPHWFNGNFKNYNNKESKLPIDQHMLIALIAPRPVYVASAIGDPWADPKGEFLSAYHAGEVYQLYGLEGLPTDQMPEVDKPIHKSIGYHIRTGAHDVKDFDWEAWMDFADMHFNR